MRRNERSLRDILGGPRAVAVAERPPMKVVVEYRERYAQFRRTAETEKNLTVKRQMLAQAEVYYSLAVKRAGTEPAHPRKTLASTSRIGSRDCAASPSAYRRTARSLPGEPSGRGPRRVLAVRKRRRENKILLGQQS
jgi:hypothetical protein